MLTIEISTQYIQIRLPYTPEAYLAQFWRIGHFGYGFSVSSNGDDGGYNDGWIVARCAQNALAFRYLILRSNILGQVIPFLLGSSTSKIKPRLSATSGRLQIDLKIDCHVRLRKNRLTPAFCKMLTVLKSVT